MTTQEFSDAFDTLISYQDSGIFGTTNPLSFNEYEKSLFLTRAQEELILSYYTGKNTFLESFEKTEELRRYLNPLIKNAVLENIYYIDSMSTKSYLYSLPDDLWFIIYEDVSFKNGDCKTSTNIQVVPITHDEYHKVKNNPFRGSSDIRVIRLDSGENNVELISKKDIERYYIRYISKPSPIVLIDFGDEISINGVNKKTECVLPEPTHKTILDYAVNMALHSRTLNNNKK